MYAETKEAIPAAMNGLDGIKDGCRESKGSTQGETVKMDEHGRTWMNMDEYGLKSFMLSRGRDCSCFGAGQDYLKLWNVIDWITIAFGFTTVSLGVRWFVCVLRHGCFHLWRGCSLQHCSGTHGQMNMMNTPAQSVTDRVAMFGFDLVARLSCASVQTSMNPENR